MKEPVEIVLVEDSGWRDLRPLTWLRPAGELYVGAYTNRERWQRAAGDRVRIWCRPEIARLDPRRLREPPQGSERRLWARDRWTPETDWLRETVGRETPCAWIRNGRIVSVLTDAEPPEGEEPGSDPFWEALAAGIERSDAERGMLLERLADLIAGSAERIAVDLDAMLVGSGSPRDAGDGRAYALDRIRLGPGCRIDHGAVLDAREGPIILGAGTVVSPQTWIQGPFGCRSDVQLLGGRIGGGSFLGPSCRVRGEVEASVFHGFTNKAHDGFVGHSYIGEWVNLGALTTTSDLKNNYSPVHLEIDGERVETGQIKIGVFMGDHAKTRIGAMLNSGSVIGLGSNLFGEASLFPRWVPDFIWGTGPGAGEYEFDRCVQTIRTVLARRGHTCSHETIEALETAFDGSRAARGRFLAKES